MKGIKSVPLKLCRDTNLCLMKCLGELYGMSTTSVLTSV